MKRAVHPGEVLRKEFLVGVSANQFAKKLGVPTNRVTEILAGRRGVTAKTALLLGRALGTTAEYWMNLQQAFDLQAARKVLGRKGKSL